MLLEDLRTRPNQQVVGVGEEDLIIESFGVLQVGILERRLSGDRHEYGGFDGSVQRLKGQSASPAPWVNGVNNTRESMSSGHAAGTIAILPI